MTPRERWLAAIHLRPVDRLPFWPKLDGAYPPAQPAPFADMGLEAIHDWIGSDKHVWGPECVREVRTRTSVETSSERGIRRTVFRTPHGQTELAQAFDESSQSWHPIKFPVRTVEDIKLMSTVFEDVRIEPDEHNLRTARERCRSAGETALTAERIGESPLMHWVEWTAGVEMAHYLLADHRAAVETLFATMHDVLLRKLRLMCEQSPADVLYLMENTSTTLISPAQFQRYCVKHIGEYARTTADAGRNLVLHMCGRLKALLPDLAQLPAQAFEAFTSPSLGDTTLLDGRAACPDKCLIGGTNAVLWTQPANEIIAQIEADLDALPHHRGIAVTSAGIMPPLCRPETIRTVCDRVKSYPVRI